MKSADDIRKSFKELHIPTSATLDEKIHEEILSTKKERQNAKAPNERLNFRKIIMESKMTKLTAAVAVIIVIAITMHWFGADVSAYGITEALDLWKNAETVHIKGWSFLHTGDDTQLEKFPFEFWFDKRNGRYKYWRPWDWFGDYTTETPRYHLKVSDGQYIMDTSYRENYDDNKIYPMVSFTKLSLFQQRLQKHTLEPFPPFMTNLHQVKGFTKPGQEQIKNKTVDIWQGEIIAAGKTIPHSKMKIWLSSKTGKIVRILQWTNTEDNSIRWLLTSDTDMIEYNVTPPADCFRTEPPDGFESVKAKEAVTENELGDDGSGVRFYDCIGFTLEDGSVIYGWHANHKPYESQAYLFEDLSPGGPLPNLPAQIIALKPWPVESEITFIGRHLVFTRKKGKFYEWGIYVSKKKPPERDTFNAYKVVTKFNDTEPRAFGSRPNLMGEELTVHTEAEFDTWVRGAMAELSDDAKAPEHITYQNVLQLTRKIRDSLKNTQTSGKSNEQFN